MTYILILVFSVHGGMSATTAEFATQEACESALEIVKTNILKYGRQLMICVPKGKVQ